MGAPKLKHLEQFIIEAGKVTFTTADGRCWRMCQPTPEEAADGDSAYRVTHRRVMEDKRLAELAGSKEELEREARIRASAAEAVYLLPLLLEKPMGWGSEEKQGRGEWMRAFDPFDSVSLAEFEALDGAIVAEMTRIYWSVIQQAIFEAKKKVSGGFLMKLVVCQGLGKWPFLNGPETMTYAQLLFYEEAVGQLAEAKKEGQGAVPGRRAKPRRLKGEAWEAIKRKAEDANEIQNRKQSSSQFYPNPV